MINPTKKTKVITSSENKETLRRTDHYSHIKLQKLNRQNVLTQKVIVIAILTSIRTIQVSFRPLKSPLHPKSIIL